MGVLLAKIIYYTDEEHLEYETLESAELTPGSNEISLNFTAPADSVWLMIGRPYDEGIEQEGSIMRITSATMYKYNWTVSPGYTGALGLPIFNPYRFAYNGQERMDEKAGKANHYTAKFWEYDARKAIRENRDPVVDHSFSPYAVFRNNPILFSDHLGNVGEPIVEGNTLIIKSHILFYGGAATRELAEVAKNNIQSQWSSKGSVVFAGKEYQNVLFKVTYDVVDEKTAQHRAAANVGEYYDPRLNFARIESREQLGDPNLRNRTALSKGKMGDNSFFLVAEDLLPGNTSQAHEMGHGFGGTGHSSEWQRLSGQPDIMSTINSLVDGDYTTTGKQSELNPMYGQKPINPLNPNMRKVTQQNLNNMRIERYDKGNVSRGLGKSGYRVGSSSNDLFDSKGTPVGGKSNEVIIGSPR